MSGNFAARNIWLAGAEPTVAVLQSVQLATKAAMRQQLATTRKNNVAFLPEKRSDLTPVVKAWPILPNAVRAGILAMVQATNGMAR
jgi:transposase